MVGSQATISIWQQSVVATHINVVSSCLCLYIIRFEFTNITDVHSMLLKALLAHHQCIYVIDHMI